MSANLRSMFNPQFQRIDGRLKDVDTALALITTLQERFSTEIEGLNAKIAALEAMMPKPRRTKVKP